MKECPICKWVMDETREGQAVSLDCPNCGYYTEYIDANIDEESEE